MIVADTDAFSGTNPPQTCFEHFSILKNFERSMAHPEDSILSKRNVIVGLLRRTSLSSDWHFSGVIIFLLLLVFFFFSTSS